MQTEQNKQRTHNTAPNKELMLAPLREAAWRLRLSGSVAALVELLPATAFVGAAIVRLDYVPDVVSAELNLPTDHAVVVGPYVA